MAASNNLITLVQQAQGRYNIPENRFEHLQVAKWGSPAENIPMPNARLGVLKLLNQSIAELKSSNKGLSPLLAAKANPDPKNWQQYFADLTRENGLLSSFFRAVAGLIDKTSEVSTAQAEQVRKQAKVFIEGVTETSPVYKLISSLLEQNSNSINKEGIPQDWVAAVTG